MNIRITGLPADQKISAIKTVRFAFNDTGLKAAKDLVESITPNENGTLTIEGEMSTVTNIKMIRTYIKEMKIFGKDELAMPNVTVEFCKTPRPKISDLKAKIKALETARDESTTRIVQLEIQHNHNTGLLNDAQARIRQLQCNMDNTKAFDAEEIERFKTQRDQAIDERNQAIHDLKKLANYQGITTTMIIGNQTITIINADSINIESN